MKSVVTSQANLAARAESVKNEVQRAPTAGARPQLRVIHGELPKKPQLPPISPSSKIEISAEGRAILSLLAERAESELAFESPEETIASLVAEGIEEGFLE